MVLLASLLSVAMMMPTVWLCRFQWRRATRPLLHVAQLPICPMLFGCVQTRHMVFGCWTRRSTWSPLRVETNSCRPVIWQTQGGCTVEGRASIQLKPKRRKAPACAHFLFQVLHVWPVDSQEATECGWKWDPHSGYWTGLISGCYQKWPWVDYRTSLLSTGGTVWHAEAILQ